MKTIIPAGVAIGTALVILLSYFIPNPYLVAIRAALVNWAVVLAGLALLLGVLNLLIVHTRRLQAGQRGGVYGLLTVLALLLTLVLGAGESLLAGRPLLYEPTSVAGTLFRGVVAPSLAALASLVMFFLVAAAVRLLRGRFSGWSVLFLVVVVVALVGWIPLNLLRPLDGLRTWLVSVPAMAGTRGMLLGVALGTLVIGLRFLTASEHPYTD